MTRYVLTAGALGLGWFVVLLVPRVTREWLLASPLQNLVCLAIASILVAIMCRGFIGRAETFRGHLLRATVLPYVGCIVFLTVIAAIMWTKQLLVGGLANAHDTLSLYAMGLTATTVSLLVVIPYGLLCQYAMKSAGFTPGRSAGTP